MIGSVACEGAKAGVWKQCIPVAVHEAAVQTHQSRFITAAAPSVSAINKRDFNEAQCVDKLVEIVGLRSVEVGSVFIFWAARKIEITKNHPRARDGFSKGGKLVEEGRSVLPLSGSIDIGEHQSAVIRRKHEP